VVAGVVNFFRWGSPATFADFTLYIMNRGVSGGGIAPTHPYGLFNIARIPFGLGYFFAPIWVFQGGADGKLLFEAEQTRLLEAAELPPSSFFLTDLLPIVFIVFLASSILRGQLPRLISLKWLLALAAGLAVPCALMLMAIYMSYRYRMEFYPEIDLLAFLGLYTATSSVGSLAILHRHRRWTITATLVSVISAHGALLLYKLSNYGPPQNELRDGIVAYYAYYAAHALPQ
jgi:hypothetical protein